MCSTVAYIFFLLLNAILVRTTPITPGLGTDTDTSLIQPNASTFPITSPSPPQNFCSLKTSSNLLTDGEVQIYRFAVPRTTTILIVYYCPSLPIERSVIHSTIATARGHMLSQVETHGNARLQAADDPYSTPVVEGMNCTMTINSQRVPGTAVIPNRLTYQVTLNALRGLMEFLFLERHSASAVTEVIDPGVTGSMVRIGLVSIYPRE